MTNAEDLKNKGIDIKQLKNGLIVYISQKFDEYMGMEVDDNDIRRNEAK